MVKLLRSFRRKDPDPAERRRLGMRYRTLNRNWQYNRVYGRGKSYVHPHVVLYVAKNRAGVTRVGLTATKKVGHAVQRNRARRVMREALGTPLAKLRRI